VSVLPRMIRSWPSSPSFFLFFFSQIFNMLIVCDANDLPLYLLLGFFFALGFFPCWFFFPVGKQNDDGVYMDEDEVIYIYMFVCVCVRVCACVCVCVCLIRLDTLYIFLILHV
jgi:hypothetical protein